MKYIKNGITTKEITGETKVQNNLRNGANVLHI